MDLAEGPGRGNSDVGRHVPQQFEQQRERTFGANAAERGGDGRADRRLRVGDMSGQEVEPAFAAQLTEQGRHHRVDRALPRRKIPQQRLDGVRAESRECVTDQCPDAVVRVLQHQHQGAGGFVAAHVAEALDGVTPDDGVRVLQLGDEVSQRQENLREPESGMEPPRAPSIRGPCPSGLLFVPLCLGGESQSWFLGREERRLAEGGRIEDTSQSRYRRLPAVIGRAIISGVS